MSRPASYFALVVAKALAGLKAIYRAGFDPAIAGDMLMELQTVLVQQQVEVDLKEDEGRDRGALILTLDALNRRRGKGAVHMASAELDGNRRGWSIKQERRTPGYSTRWEDMPVARA